MPTLGRQLARKKELAQKVLDERRSGEGAPVWERLPDETDTQYERFLFYLNLARGTRSTLAVCKHFDVAHKTVSSTAHRMCWLERVADYDEWQIRQQLEAAQANPALMPDAPPNWHARGRITRQDNYALGTDMFRLAREIIDDALGIVRNDDGSMKFNEDGTPVRGTRSDFKLAAKDLAAFVRMASSLRVGSVEDTVKPGEAAAETDSAGMPQIPQDVGGLTDAEINKYLSDIARFDRASKPTAPIAQPVTQPQGQGPESAISRAN